MNPNQVADNIVVSLDYTLTVEGEIVDSSEGSEPIEFIQGYGQVIPGLERELYGMQIDESKDVTVNAKDAYGEIDPSAIVDVPRSEFSPEIPVKPGVQLQVKDNEGNVMDARIVEANENTVRLDFNHPLAGKQLQFHVTVVNLREASEEEIEHGHAHHSPDGHEHE